MVPVDVMPSVAGAVHGAALPDPWIDNRQSLMDTLASYTRDNAWVEFSENSKGVLKAGFKADIVVMDRDLTTTDPAELSEASAMSTICDGKVTHSA